MFAAARQAQIEAYSSYCAATNLTPSDQEAGCVFKVGDEMYFVPTQQVAGEDMLYIACDAQKIESETAGRPSLGAVADSKAEGAIVRQLHTAARKQTRRGDLFVITSSKKTYRL